MDDRFRTVAAGVLLVITDFDGVLTDNRVYVFDDGHEAVRCNRADGLACDLLRDAGVEVTILSTERNPVVVERARKLRISATHDCPDKRLAVDGLLTDRGLEPTQVLYLGNDVNDLAAIEALPFTAAPADAHPTVRDAVSFVTDADGGAGVLREIADLLLAAR